MPRLKPAVLAHLAFALALLALAALRLRQPDMARPFETDELLTLRYYTWAGAQPSGEPRRLDHIDDLADLPPPEPVQLGMALYCGVGRWPEPNNHAVNSLLVSAALAAGARDERGVRLPALLGGVAAAALLYALCGPLLGWAAAAVLATAWAWFSPYVVTYSQTARGFSWMLALQLGMIVLAYLLARRPRSLPLAALLTAAAALSLMNVVSLAADWVLPFYVALYYFPPAPLGEAAEDRAAWRRSLRAQALAVAAVGGLFFLTRLPSLYSSARQYGLPFGSAGELAAAAGEVLSGLFPDFGTQALAAAGAVGLIALGFDRRYRFLAALAGLVIAFSLAHYLAGRRLPYARAAGHFVPLVLIGAAYLAQRAVGVFETAAGRAGMFAALLALTAGWAAAAAPALESPNLTAWLALAERAKVPAGSKVYLPVRSGVEYLISAYGPREWERVEEVPAGVSLTVLLFAADDRPAPAGLDVEVRPRYRLRRLSGPTRPLGEAAVPKGAWVFWYPDFLSLGADARGPREVVVQSGATALTTFARAQVKFDIYSHVQGFILPPDATGDAGRAAAAAREGLRRHGGRAVVFVPEEEEVTIR